MDVERGSHCPSCFCPGHENRKGNVATEVVEALRELIGLTDLYAASTVKQVTRRKVVEKARVVLAKVEP